MGNKCDQENSSLKLFMCGNNSLFASGRLALHVYVLMCVELYLFFPVTLLTCIHNYPPCFVSWQLFLSSLTHQHSSSKLCWKPFFLSPIWGPESSVRRLQSTVALVRKYSFSLGHRRKNSEGPKPSSACATAAGASQALGADLILQLFLLLLLSVG